MFDAMWLGLFQVFQWPAFGYLLLGIGVGVWVGAAPGVGGVTGLLLLLPFTFGMQPVAAFALLLGMLSVLTTSDTITAVMIGVPGSAAAQATVLDGYPLARKGHARRALGAAFTVSAFGGVFGAFILAVSLPVIKPVIMSFTSPEVFVLGLLALTMVGSLSTDAIAKGIAAGLFGLLLATVGYATSVAIPRFTFGSDYLLEGVPFVSITLGLFAVSEVMDLALSKGSISKIASASVKGGGIFDGIRDAWTHRWLALRTSVIGTYIGMLPGMASIADWVAYSHTVHTAKDKSQFGKGDIRGVIGPEAANNAIVGGSLIPALFLGIPGGPAMALLLNALLIQGLKPGPEMLTTQLPFTFSVIWTVVVANIIVAIVLMMWCTQITKIAFVPGQLVVPIIMMFILMGSWVGGATLGDWVVVLVFGVLGYLMKRGGWPRPPLILAVVIGPMMERAFHITVSAYGYVGWLARPIVLTLLGLILLNVAMVVRAMHRNAKARAVVEEAAAHPATAAVAQEEEEEAGQREGQNGNPLLSLPLSVLLPVLFVLALLLGVDWPASVRQFPIFIAVPGALLCAYILWRDGRDSQGLARQAGGFGAAVTAAAKATDLRSATHFFGYMVAILLATMVIGQKIALPLFVGCYLWRWGGYRWRVIVPYALVTWAILIGFYDKVMDLFWYPSLIQPWLTEHLPAWLPAWLLV